METIRRLKRLAEHKERMAKIDLSRAEHERMVQQQILDTHTATLASVLASRPTDAEDARQRHAYALQVELTRRRAERTLFERQRQAGLKREALIGEARERRTWEIAEENRMNEAKAEAERKLRATLDQIGLDIWWRRNSP